MIYIPPKFNESKFTCPHCGAIAHQKWVCYINGNLMNIPSNEKPLPKYSEGTKRINGLVASECEHCKNYMFWFDKKIIFPKYSTVPAPHKDMPENVKKDYVEARNIVNDSPRGACALLRLALDKLMDELEAKGTSLHNKILNYIEEEEEGRGTSLEHAFTSVRVIGNESVHIGTLDMKDNVEIAIALFEILNYIVYDTISKKKKIEEIHNILPEKKKIS